MLVRRRLLSLSSMRTDFERHFIVCYCQGVVATSNWISTCLFFPSSYKLFAIALTLCFGFEQASSRICNVNKRKASLSRVDHSEFIGIECFILAWILDIQGQLTFDEGIELE